MDRFRKTVALSALAITLAGGMSFAQDRPADRDNRDNRGGQSDNHPGPGNHAYVRHNEWKKGYRMRNEDWSRGARIDYRRYRLRRPPRGYEWREVDGNYVLAAVATGLIASVVIASTVH